MCTVVCTCGCVMSPALCYPSIRSRYGYRTGQTGPFRANGQDMQASAGGIIDPRAGLSTAPLPIVFDQPDSQTVSNVHAAMQALSRPPTRLTIHSMCTTHLVWADL